MADTKDNFVHLHAHTEYSMLDGHSLIKEYCEEVARLGQPAAAITDHGTEHGIFEMFKYAKEYGIQAIAGMEAYMTPGLQSRSTQGPIFFGEGGEQEEGGDDVSGKGAYTHLTLLAETNEGLYNLFNLTSESYMSGWYRKPRIDAELLSENSKGIIATTGCPSGDLQTYLRLGQHDKALEYAATMQDIMGRDNYFLELMDHNMRIDLERKVRGDLLDIACKLKMPIIATNDLHYVKQADSHHHEAMLAIQTGSNMSEPSYEDGGKRFAFDGNQYYVKSRAEMAENFKDLPEALDNTLLIAERASGVKLEPRDDLRPAVEIPAGHTDESWLRKEAYEGLERRYGRENITALHRERMEKELDVIVGKNYVQYFLVVSDFVRWGKANGVEIGPGRGSAGGSLLSYCLDITELDPIRYNLLFERFLNPERDSPPDIDIDFDDHNRSRVIEYCVQKYGKDKVAMVATFGKLKAKAAIKDVLRIYEQPFSLGDKLSKSYPPDVMGKSMPLNDVYKPDAKRYEEAHEFREIVKKESADKFIEVARGIEGRSRQTGVHAAGVIISSKPLRESVPLMVRQADKTVITQFDYPTCETLGLLKVDFLGLKNLTIIRDCLDHIYRNHGIKLETNDIIHGPMDDQKTFDLFQRGQTLGVFQVEGGAMRELLKRMNPTDISHITAVLALYRPGPMGANAHLDYADRKNGVQEVKPIHPEFAESLKDILDPTYQIICYQEQIMQIAQVVAGYTLARADNLRRAMGKKKREVLEEEFIPFQEGARKNGYSDAAIQALWDILVPFADYGFNLSHAAGYALISYITAYLKANYAPEYMAALLSMVSKDKDKTAQYLHECKEIGIEVTAPDVNLSGITYTPVKGEMKISAGFSGIRGIGEPAAKDIIEARTAAGGFKDFNDFLAKVPDKVINKKIIEGLAYSGGFDAFGVSRKAIIDIVIDKIPAVKKAKKKIDSGQADLFSMLDDDSANLEFNLVDIPEDYEEWPKQYKLSKEREYVGLYLSDHPLSGIADQLKAFSDCNISDILDGTVKPVDGFVGFDTPRIKISGVISAVQRKKTKKGDSFAILTLEDETGSIEVPVFPKTYQEYIDVIAVDRVFTLTGVPKQRDEETPTFQPDRLTRIDLTNNGEIPAWFKLTDNQVTPESVEAFKKIISQFPGSTQICMSVMNARREIKTWELEYRVNPTPAFFAEVKELYGSNCVGRWHKS